MKCCKTSIKSVHISETLATSYWSSEIDNCVWVMPAERFKILVCFKWCVTSVDVHHQWSSWLLSSYDFPLTLANHDWFWISQLPLSHWIHLRHLKYAIWLILDFDLIVLLFIFIMQKAITSYGRFALASSGLIGLFCIAWSNTSFKFYEFLGTSCIDTIQFILASLLPRYGKQSEKKKKRQKSSLSLYTRWVIFLN